LKIVIIVAVMLRIGQTSTLVKAVLLLSMDLTRCVKYFTKLNGEPDKTFGMWMKPYNTPNSR
jgi:hypothetical protein